MTIKTRALVKTVFFIGTMVLAALGTTALLEYLDPTQQDVMYTVVAILCGVMTYIVYSYNVSQLEYRAKLEEMTEK